MGPSTARVRDIGHLRQVAEGVFRWDPPQSGAPRACPPMCLALSWKVQIPNLLHVFGSCASSDYTSLRLANGQVGCEGSEGL